MERTPRLAPQYEPHTEPRPCDMIRRKGARPPSFLFRTKPSCKIGCIAQLVEHWAFNLMVAGSSPAIPKKTTLVFVRMRDKDPNQCIHLGQNSLYHNSSFPYWDRFQEYPGRWRSLLSCLPTRVGNFLWWVTSLLFGLSSSAKTSFTYYALTYLVLGLIVEIP